MPTHETARRASTSIHRRVVIRGSAWDRLSQGGGWPPSVILPWYTQFAGQDRPIAGQVGGRMGEVNRPFLVQGDPSQPGFHVAGLRLPEGLSLWIASPSRPASATVRPSSPAACSWPDD